MYKTISSLKNITDPIKKMKETIENNLELLEIIEDEKDLLQNIDIELTELKKKRKK